MCMKNFIYCTDTNGVTAPVVTVTGDTVRTVSGYDLGNLQRFVKGETALPQDGTYVETNKDYVDELEHALNVVHRLGMLNTENVISVADRTKSKFDMEAVLGG